MLGTFVINLKLIKKATVITYPSMAILFMALVKFDIIKM